MRLQTIARFHDFHEAWALRCRLEAYGIEAFCPEEKFVQGNWAHLFATEGLRIQVADSDAERARSIIETPVEGLAVPSECCPDCGSDNTVLRETERNVVKAVLLIPHLLIPFRDRLVCLDCKALRPSDGEMKMSDGTVQLNAKADPYTPPTFQGGPEEGGGE